VISVPHYLSFSSIASLQLQLHRIVFGSAPVTSHLWFSSSYIASLVQLQLHRIVFGSVAVAVTLVSVRSAFRLCAWDRQGASDGARFDRVFAFAPLTDDRIGFTVLTSVLTNPSAHPTAVLPIL
jgi:hypothetical protein